MKTHTGLLIFAATLVGLTTLTITGCSGAADMTGATGSYASAVEVRDAEVTAKVRTALLGDDAGKRFDIAVVTTKGDVRLTGILDSPNQIDRVTSVVRGIDGVHSIHDEMTLKE